MPEGDTIFRAARTLHAALAGSVITQFETVFPQLARRDVDAPMIGRTVESVTAAGKNLLMTFSGDLHLRTHMRMNGSWHVYRPGERWRKRRSDMRIVIGTERYVAVAFNVPVAEFHDSRSLARDPVLQEIGPDLLGDTFDESEALARIGALPEEEIADVILNQRVVAGIGNEYKSELLFMARISPFSEVQAVQPERLAALLAIARKVMLANVRMRTGARVTTGSLDFRERTFVYGRGGKPCRRCGTAIEFVRQGRDARGTYWCPRCQP